MKVKASFAHNRYFIGLVALIVFGGAVSSAIYVYASSSDSRMEVAAQPGVGELAPDFELVSQNGEAYHLYDLRGKPVLINFWATWCAPCLLEMPNIQKYYEKFPNDFTILAINAGESEKAVMQFVDDIGISFPVLLDPDTKIQSLYKIKGYPTTFFVDKDGFVRVQHIGMLSEKQLGEYLATLGIEE